uniref:NADH dehydrogenase subunit 2 n=1 Tax=Elthusa poutassouiensis TaxID=3104314 RepID=UPI002E76F910|nr:NADH dehydrogenase subunit 2 [Elthusa poutassouiensis]WPS93552.1 NADH dehydrogenase subunit 2 [Elthusa poutassouiensis]
MQFSYQLMLALSGIIVGIGLTITSENPFGVWFGLEINMFSFIFFLLLEEETSPEIAVKYFLIQAAASFVFMLTMMFSYPFLSYMFILFAMALKTGMAPFHFWLPQISEKMKWSRLLILFSLQKLAPWAIINSTYTSSLETSLTSLMILSAIVGALGGINEPSLPKLMAFSSIAHMSWMAMSVIISTKLWIFYFLMYLTSFILLIMPLLKTEVYQISNIWAPKFSFLTSFSLSISMLSLMGLPPLLGFMPKFILIINLTYKLYLLTLSILIMSSMISIYYYLRLTLSFKFLKQSCNYFFSKKDGHLSIPLSLNILGLITLPLTVSLPSLL